MTEIPVMSTANSNMPAGSGGGLHHEIQEAITQMELLKVSELKAICRSIELPITGRKSILQDRIRTYLKNSCSIGRIDPWRPKTIRILIEKSKSGQALPKYEILWQAIRSGAFNHPVATGHLPISSLQDDSMIASSQAAYLNGSTIRPSDLTVSVAANDPPKASQKNYIHFKESPFYKMRKLIPETAQKISITNVRGVCSCKFKFTKAEWNLLESDKKYKLYLFCGAANSTGSIGNEPIQFPHPNEIRFNDTQIKDNVRGLKNKLGTAKPADLTPYLRPLSQQNVLEIVYAFTKNEFFTYCYIVEEVSPENLLQDVLKRPKIIKAATLHYIKQTLSEEEDDDLVTTSTVMSLQCPVSYTRMKYPVKSIMCKHLQCFDALWYIYSQMQIPTWQCPVCQIDIDLKNLAICEYVDAILKSSDEEVEQVELSSDGSWVPVVEEATKPTEKQHSHAVVKTENSYDDYDNIPLSRQQEFGGAIAGPSEPVVISLDSDMEDDDALADSTNQVLRQKQSETSKEPNNNNGTLSQPRLYMDSSSGNSGQTLDPRAHEEGTPLAIRRESDRAEYSVNYLNREIPNMLEKTPLNNNMADLDLSLPEPEPDTSPTPTTNTLIRGLFPTGAEVDLNREPTGNLIANNYGSHSQPMNGSSTAEAGIIDHASLNSARRQSDNISSSILGLTGNPAAPLQLPISNHIPQNETGRAFNDSDTLIPRLPPLPLTETREATTRKNMNGHGNGHGNGNANPGTYGRGKKPIVSPFIPKKPYLNILPQKRHVSNNGQNSLSPQPALPLNDGQRNEGDNHWSPPVADSSSTHTDAVIDLTSD